MALKLKNESTYNLSMYVQWLEGVAGELTDFFWKHVDTAHKAGHIDTSFRDQMEVKLRPELDKVNAHLEKLEKELAGRIRSKFPDVISYAKMERIAKEFNEALPDVAQLDEKGADKPKPQFTVMKSRAKNHDSKSK